MRLELGKKGKILIGELTGNGGDGNEVSGAEEVENLPYGKKGGECLECVLHSRTFLVLTAVMISCRAG